MNERRRLDRILDPAYLEGIEEWDPDELRVMKRDCDEVELELSYIRRLAQARIELIQAERDRRTSGASLADLVADLPRLLAGGPRPAPARSRLPALLAPSPDIAWKRGAEELIQDGTLARLPDLPPEDLERILRALHDLEHDMSDRRQRVHEVIDTLEAVLARA